MNTYFQKIQLEIFYPQFDNGYNKAISSIHYQVVYPDLQGNQVFRAKCFLTSGNERNLINLEPAIWTASSHYDQMIFYFLKPDKPPADLIIRRSIHFKPEFLGIDNKSLLSEISVNTYYDEEENFIINERTKKIDVQNKIAIAIVELGTRAGEDSKFFTTEF